MEFKILESILGIKKEKKKDGRVGNFVTLKIIMINITFLQQR